MRLFGYKAQLGPKIHEFKHPNIGANFGSIHRSTSLSNQTWQVPSMWNLGSFAKKSQFMQFTPII